MTHSKYDIVESHPTQKLSTPSIIWSPNIVENPVLTRYMSQYIADCKPRESILDQKAYWRAKPKHGFCTIYLLRMRRGVGVGNGKWEKDENGKGLDN